MRIIIVGAGAHGKVVLDILRDRGEEIVGWVDDNKALWGTRICGLEVLGGLDYFRSVHREHAAAVVAVGHNEQRMALGMRLEEMGVSLANAIHPSAVVSSTAKLGRNVCICAGAIVGTDACIGNHVLMNTASAIDHDCILEEGACMAPGARAAGAVKVGRCAYVSTGAVVVAGVFIGECAVVGAGAVVTKHLPPRVLALGTPARVVRKIDDTFNWTRLVSGIARQGS